MMAKRLTPILNVSDIEQSFAWFEKLGWTKAWDWGSPPTFGGVCSGQMEIFLCQDGQGWPRQGRSQDDVRSVWPRRSPELILLGSNRMIRAWDTV